MFEFSEFLERLGLDPKRVRLLRHDVRGLAAWQRAGEVGIGCFASFQWLSPSPYTGVHMACHFVPGPTLADGDATALFIGVTRILDRWDWDGHRLPCLRDPEILEANRGRLETEAFDLEWLPAARAYSERLLVRWGAQASARDWSQWADRTPKEIVEYRLTPLEPPFPGFAAFLSRISTLPLCPLSWQVALGSVCGVYLLVADDGAQYVGSASGEDGFMGPWRRIITNGHGGIARLRQAGQRDYLVSILEVASPDTSRQDILAREALWTRRLGPRACSLGVD